MAPAALMVAKTSAYEDIEVPADEFALMWSAICVLVQTSHVRRSASDGNHRRHREVHTSPTSMSGAGGCAILAHCTHWKI